MNLSKGIWEKKTYHSYQIKEGVKHIHISSFLDRNNISKEYYQRHLEANEFSGFFRNGQEFRDLHEYMVKNFLDIVPYPYYENNKTGETRNEL